MLRVCSLRSCSMCFLVDVFLRIIWGVRVAVGVAPWSPALKYRLGCAGSPDAKSETPAEKKFLTENFFPCGFLLWSSLLAALHGERSTKPTPGIRGGLGRACSPASWSRRRSARRSAVGTVPCVRGCRPVCFSDSLVGVNVICRRPRFRGSSSAGFPRVGFKKSLSQLIQNHRR